MKEEFVELKLQFLKGQVEIKDSKDPDFPDGRYQSYSRLVKKIGDKLYLEVVMSNKNAHLRCHKCKRRVPLLYPFGYVYKQIACSEGESIIICLDCLSKATDQELAFFVMNYGHADLPPSCADCPDKNDPTSCPVKQKWDKIGTEVTEEIEAFLDERERKKR
ncbi:MAG: hypothetical protein WC891_06335 [Actinomycetota bacterium]